MDYPVFRKGLPDAAEDADGRAGSPSAEDIVGLDSEDFDDPGRYFVSEPLNHAINVALILGRPLLVTGEPGTGKTELAGAIAHELKCGRPHRFETKSTSIAKDLFYTFDVLGRYASKDVATMREGSADPSDARLFIEYQALGRAILDAFERKTVADFLPASGASAGFAHSGPKRSVVIIDEIDKAPRDFPNDLLNEIDRMAFRVPELGGIATPGMENRRERMSAKHRPIVVITSNSEKGLPDAFLRRCVYFDIPFPNDDELKRIVGNRIERLKAAPPMVLDALKLFRHYRVERGKPGLRKKPGTAEFLNWLQVLLQMNAKPGEALKTEARLGMLEQSMPALVKNRDDRPEALGFLKDWVKSAE